MWALLLRTALPYLGTIGAAVLGMASSGCSKQTSIKDGREEGYNTKICYGDNPESPTPTPDRKPGQNVDEYLASIPTSSLSGCFYANKIAELSKNTESSKFLSSQEYRLNDRYDLLLKNKQNQIIHYQSPKTAALAGLPIIQGLYFSRTGKMIPMTIDTVPHTFVDVDNPKTDRETFQKELRTQAACLQGFLTLVTQPQVAVPPKKTLDSAIDYCIKAVSMSYDISSIMAIGVSQQLIISTIDEKKDPTKTAEEQMETISGHIIKSCSHLPERMPVNCSGQ